jgi:hypothetical protein
LKLKSDKSHVTQITLDEATAANVERVKRYLREVIGRPVSNSLIHRAGIAVLLNHLRNTSDATDIHRLIHPPG